MLATIQSRLTIILAASHLIAIGALSVPLASNAQDSEGLPAGVSAIVNGQPIATELINNVENQLTSNDLSTNRDEILLELINLEVLTQRAEAQKFDSEPNVAAKLRLQYAQTMANAYLESLSEEIVVTDAEIRSEYDEQIQLLNRPEYRASHILVDTEAEGVSAIAALDAGGDFAQLATELSTGPSASQGGDLGWFDDDTMMAEFTAAVAELDINEYTKTPVKTQFGWHVIQLFDKRSGAVPEFDTVKNGIRNLMIQDLLQERIAELREQSDIQTAQ